MNKLLSNGLFRGGLYSLTLIIILFIFIWDAPSRYVVTEQYSFNAKGKSKIALMILVPKTMTYQQISNLKIKGGEKVSIRDTALLQIVTIEPQEVKDSVIIVLSYDVYLPKGQISWQGTTTTDDISPQPEIESNNPELVAKSKLIAGGKTMDDVRKTYNFVSSWLKWPKGPRINTKTSAMIAYTTRVGGCKDFAQLLTAMLRANGIPARSISGLALPQFVNIKDPASWSHQAEAHAWIEFFADGKWHFADPAWGGSSHFDRCDGFHLSFGEAQDESRIYENSKSLLVSKFTSAIKPDSTFAFIGSMTAPLKFLAVASNKQVKISPKGIVKINYGYRLFLLITIILLLIILLIADFKTRFFGFVKRKMF